MKPRKWVLVFCLILLTMGGASYQGIRLLEKNGTLKSILSQQVSPLVGGTFEYERLRIGLFSVYLKNVKLTVPLRLLSVDIEDIKVGFSLWRLIKSRGDVGQCISKIIFIHPAFTVFFADSVPTPNALTPSSPPAFPVASSSLPVPSILIKRATARFVGVDGDSVLLGEQLNGRIRDTNGEGVAFELRGRLGARRRNLSVNGLLATDGCSVSRASIRLTRASLSTPLQLPAVRLAQGSFDGLIELSLGPQMRAAQLQLRGWAHVADATVLVNGLDQPLNNVKLALSLGGEQWVVDTLAATWKGARLQAQGSWDCRHQRISSVSLALEDVDPHRIIDSLPPFLGENLFGSGWVTLLGSYDEQTGRLKSRLEGGGLSVFGQPLTMLRGALYLKERVLGVDSLRVGNAFFSVRFGGTGTLSDAGLEYDVRMRGLIDSLPPSSSIEGDITLLGHVTMHNRIPTMRLSASADMLKFFNIPIRGQCIELLGEGAALRFVTSAGEEELALEGSVSGLGEQSPHLRCTARLGSAPFRRFVHNQKLLDSSQLRTMYFDGLFEGDLQSWNAAARLELAAKRVEGSVGLTLQRQRGGVARVDWRVSESQLRAGLVPIPLEGQGRIVGDTLLLDSLDLFGALRVTGNMLMDKSNSLAMSISYDSLSLAKVDGWFFNGSFALDSGMLSGHTRLSGTVQNPVSSSQIRLQGGRLGPLEGLATDVVVHTRGASVTMLPAVVRKGGHLVMSLDTITNAQGFRLAGTVENLPLNDLFGSIFPQEMQLGGMISGRFATTDTGLPVQLELNAASVQIDSTRFDSLRVRGRILQHMAVVDEVSLRDSALGTMVAQASLPWSFFGEEVLEGDSLKVRARIKGDLLALIKKHVQSPIAGQGLGTVELGLVGSREGWAFERLEARIDTGTLELYPLVLAPLRNFSAHITMDTQQRVFIALAGWVHRKPIYIRTTHEVPQGYEPFILGPLNCGVLQIQTPKNGAEIHLPGFQDIGEPVEVEVLGKAPFSEFSLSGPLDKLRITGTLLVRSAEFTYPFLKTNELALDFDPFPYITWDLDVRPDNRKVMYYWDFSSGKRRKLLRIVEGFLDPTTIIQVRGRDLDKTFRILGSLRSYKGSAFFGRIFDRRFEVGLDFVPQRLPQGGYDNMPILWGSAEAFSDTSRFERKRVTLQTQDPVSGAVSERGRLRLVPRRERGGADSVLNMIFSLSSEGGEVGMESDEEFFRETGLRFSTLGGAGELVSSMGEQYLHRSILQRYERKIARRLGLDVLSFETSIASNYFSRFYNRQHGELREQLDLLALANLGVTVGRYFFKDNLFLKARGEFITIEELELLIPEYSVGFEFQPVRYFMMDINYGFHREESLIRHDPRLNLQFRLPIARVRNVLKF